MTERERKLINTLIKIKNGLEDPYVKEKDVKKTCVYALNGIFQFQHDMFDSEKINSIENMTEFNMTKKSDGWYINNMGPFSSFREATDVLIEIEKYNF